MADVHLITTDEAREMLRRLYNADDEINLSAVARRAACDPIKPVSERGRMRPSIVVIVGGIMLFLVIASFVYFSFGGQR